MAESTHTPGPWTAIHLRLKSIVLKPGAAPGFTIADVHQYHANHGPDEATCRANASLIAAAPDLLEAARAVVARWDTPAWKEAEPTADVIASLRAAIIKVEAA